MDKFFRFGQIILLGFVFTGVLCAANPQFKCIDGTVSVTTGRYEVKFREGVLIYLKNRITGEDYTVKPTSGESNPSVYRGICHYPEKSAKKELDKVNRTHNWFRTWKKRFPDFDFARYPTEKSKIRFKQLGDNKARVAWFGLSNGKPDSKESFGLELEVLKPSGDLQITMRGKENSPGTAAVALFCENFNPKTEYIVPLLQGFKFKPAREKPFVTVAHWPRPMPVPLMIGETGKGAFGIWVAEPGTRDRFFYMFNRPDRFGFAFETVNHAPFRQYKQITSSPVRLNVYKGNWLKPAAAFKNWWSKTFKPDLKKDRPGANICAIAQNFKISGDMPGQFVHFVAQDWKKFDHVGDGGLFPKNIKKGPELRKLTQKFLERTRKLGGFNMVYQNIGHMNSSHPDAKKFHDYRVVNPFADERELKRKGEGNFEVDPKIMARTSFHVNCAYKPWQDLQRWWANQTYDKFGIKGEYLDVAAGQPNSLFGKIDGKSDSDGLLELFRMIKQDRPDRFITVEYLSSLTAREVDGGWLGYDNWFHQLSGYPCGPKWRAAHVHPLMGYLFNDYAHIYWKGHNSIPAFNEALGRIPMTPFTNYSEKNAVMDYAMSQTFPEFWGRLLAKRKLKPVYPENWNADVLAYYRDWAGNLYEVRAEVPGEGIFYQVKPSGERSLVYHRISGRSRAKVEPGKGVEGWIAYADDQAIGLNPAKNYYYFGNPRISDWEITRLPENCIIKTVCPFKTGLLKLDLAKLNAAKQLKGSLKLISGYTLHHAVVNGKAIPIKATGNVRGKKQYEVEISGPGEVDFIAGKFNQVELKPGKSYSLLDIKPDYAKIDKSGIRKLYRKQLTPRVWQNSFKLFGGLKQPFQLNFPLCLPKVKSGGKLVLEFTPHAAKLRKRNYKYRIAVKVNGRKLWEKTIASDKDAGTIQVDLTACAGQDIILCLDYYCFLTVTPFRLENPQIKYLP